MEKTSSYTEMDANLKQLEDDYIEALDANGSRSVEDFIQKFLNDSWEYNQSNLEMIKSVMSRYTKGEISKSTFSESFSRMVNHLQKKLSVLDENNDFPLLHTSLGASVLVSFVDGLVIQYYAGVYSVEDLRQLTPHLKSVILNALSTGREPI
ncbi:hypothetical protein [Bacillus sp. SG-1]|uniref:hypothetical protein n=1 Tax=Bacillus sp. SG-1 TaxID=161544 RepID=UPI0001543D01|nr:hypothetical protein [Bacillus sp. SG-1]EDL65612.1 hypothetical protein BSG1_00900 [Bacillus sp. SG-1]